MAVAKVMKMPVLCIALLLTYATVTSQATTTNELVTTMLQDSSSNQQVTTEFTTAAAGREGTTKQEDLSTTSTEAAAASTKSQTTTILTTTVDTSNTIEITTNTQSQVTVPTSAVTGDAESTTAVTTSAATPTVTPTPPATSSEPTVVVTDGENATTSSTTTTATATTTTLPITTTAPGSIDLANKFFDMILSVKFNNKFVVELNDSSSLPYFTYSKDIRTQLNLAFEDCPGFESKKTTIIEFIEGSIIANYSTSYRADYMLLTPDSNVIITTYIIQEAFERLKNNASFENKLTVDDDYLNSTATAEVIRYNATFANYKLNPCDSVSRCSPCHRCDVTTTALKCVAECLSPSQACYVTNGQTSGKVVEECGCAINYLLFAGTCVHQNLIIGVFAGVGGALVASFVITLVVCCHYRNKSSKKNQTASLMRLDSEFDHRFHPTEGSNSQDYRGAYQTETTRKVDATDTSCQMTVGAEHSAYPPVDYLPDEVRQSAEFKNFCPHLENVNSYGEVKIRRPTLYEHVADA